jgi:glycosyltransferase involved in cell wall biosynthesis
MSSTVIGPGYIELDGAATDSLTAARKVRSTPEKLALVIPTLREAENISGLLDHVRSVLDPVGIAYEILVVDDDSQDGTEGIVTAIARQDQRVRLLVRRGERGLSGAVLYGWQNTDASILGVMDADLQHPPELLPALLNSIKTGHDLVIGSRYIAGGRLGDWNPIRKLVSAAAVWATWPIQRSGLYAKDSLWCGGNALSRFHFSVRASSSCLRFWCADTSGRLKRFPWHLACGIAGPARPTSRSRSTTAACWRGSTRAA